MHHVRRHLLFLIMAFCAASASASIGLVVGEPFGGFGTMLPVGHAGIYLDHLCADSPTHLRRCLPGEQPGVVISRYHDLNRSQLDWLATPAFVFFYGVESPADVPNFVTPALRDNIRIAYREAHLRDVVPGSLPTHFESDGALHFRDGEDWQESIGSAFDRRLFVYMLGTTNDQDVDLLNFVNDLPNRRRYSLRRANCADFAADILRVVLPVEHPTVLHRNRLADFDITTPKSLARQLDTFGHDHPELGFAVYEVPQLPGTTRRSRPVRGCAELFLTTKRYLITLAVLQPEFILADTAAFEVKGRWKPLVEAIPITPADWPRLSTVATTPPAIEAPIKVE
jgi:hypothetical protein